MCTAAEVSGAARTSPIIPNRHPPAIVTMRTTSGWIPSVAPNAIGCTICWSPPFARITTTSMISADGRPFGAERDDHGERARHECADVRDVGAEEGDERDRRSQRHAEDERRDPDDDRVERGDDRDAQEVPPERREHVAGDRLRHRQRHAEMPVDRGAQRGPSLSRKKRLSRRNERPSASDAMSEIPSKIP